MAKVEFNSAPPAAPASEAPETPVSYSPHYDYDHGPKYSSSKNSDMNALIGAIRAMSEKPDVMPVEEAPVQKYANLLKLIRGLRVKVSK